VDHRKGPGVESERRSRRSATHVRTSHAIVQDATRTEGGANTMSRGNRRLCSVLVFLLVQFELCWPQAQSSQGNVIHVEVGGLRNNKGQVFCALYSSADGFPKDGQKAIGHATSSISDKQASCEFPGIAAGSYAVSVFHDENSNGKLDANFIGIPREGVGASNDARAHLGPPKFDAAAFHFSGGRLNLKITMNYL